MTRRRLLQVGAGVSAATFLAACGSSSKTTTEGAAKSVKRGGTLQIALSDASSTENLDPSLSFTTNDAVYCGVIYESLTTTDTQWNVKPALATEWKPNADATEWTFTLRDGVQWHDGTPFTAKDVVFSLQRWLVKDLGTSMYARLAPSMDRAGLSAVDDHTVLMKLKRPDALLPVAFALRNAKITKAGTKKFTAETAIGTGPFKLKSWTPNRSWSVEKNPSYWEKGLPYLDGVNAVVIPDQGTKLQSVTSGPSHLGDPVEISSWSSVESNKNVKLAKLEDRQCWVFILDQSTKPFNDKRVVEAVKLAMDRDKVLASVLQGKGSVTGDIPVPTSSQFYPEGLDPSLDYEKAKALLAEAGYPDGLDMELSTSAVAAGMVEMAQAFQQVMKPAGIRVKLKQWPTSAYWNKAWMQTMAFQDYWNHRHPADMLSLFYSTQAVWNEAKHKDSAIDAQIEEVFRSTDVATQRTAIQKAFEYAADNIGYTIPAFAPSGWVHKTGVQGLELNYTDYVELTKVSLS